MIKENLNSYCNWTYPSNNDLFYVSPDMIRENTITLTGDDFHHATRVMKYHTGQQFYAANGLGNVFFVEITTVSKNECEARIIEKYTEELRFPNISFCLPILKSLDRIEFAVEKLVELGFTNIYFYQADKAIKPKISTSRLEKIALHAMKQSLHAHLPKFNMISKIQDLPKENTIICLSQNADLKLREFQFLPNMQYTLIFGPEGGFSDREELLLQKVTQLQLVPQRLRAETAIIQTASVIAALI